jgi:hypothetical protein
MRENCESTSSFRRRAAAALVGVWLGVSCLFCCGDVTRASAVSGDERAGATQTSAASDDPCCHARLRRQEKGGAHVVVAENVARAAAAKAGARALRLPAGDGGACVRCSRQVASTARRARLLPAPASAADYERPHASPRLDAEASRGGASMLLNRSGTHLRFCVLLI